MKFSLRFWLLATVVLCLGGGAYFCLLASVPAEVPSTAANPRKFVPVVAENEVAQAKADIEKRAIAFLQAGDFSALDAMAREFRVSQVTYANGGRPLNLFYQALRLDESAPENEWETRLGLLRHWFEADVESITARVAMADALVMYAWHARGIEWARDVKQDAWRVMSERVTEAHRILEAARNLPEKCPYWYTCG
jgi:hypothetical protein